MAKRERWQCRKCPWKRGTDPRCIPNGYDEAKHCALQRTIAREGVLNLSELRLMACHESPIGRDRVCVGWLHNQLTVGNNIGLRLAVFRGQVSADYRLVGPQHERFEDTLPEPRE